MDRKVIGERLKRRREELDLTLRDVGAKAGIDFGYVRRIERGEKNVTVNVLEKLAKALEVPLDELDASAPNSAANLIARLERIVPYVKPEALDTLRHVVEGWERVYGPQKPRGKE